MNNITIKNNGNDRIRTYAGIAYVISSHTPSPLGHVTINDTDRNRRYCNENLSIQLCDNDFSVEAISTWSK